MIRCAAALAALFLVMTAPARAEGVPEFRVDPFRPKPLPNNWILGQIGGAATDRNDHVWVYHRRRTLTDELYVDDGYGNKRIVVFDGRTGEYRRHWGAYGAKPDDADPGKYEPGVPIAKQFRNPVHCVRISHDGLVYVCDRVNDRYQVFRKDGSFVAEYVLDPNTRFVGSVWDIAFSRDPEQKYLFVCDGSNNQIHILLRASGKEIV